MYESTVEVFEVLKVLWFGTSTVLSVRRKPVQSHRESPVGSLRSGVTRPLVSRQPPVSSNSHVGRRCPDLAARSYLSPMNHNEQDFFCYGGVRSLRCRTTAWGS